LFSKYLSSETHYGFDLDGYHFAFLNALGIGKHGCFGLGREQIAWLSADLHETARRNRPSVLFLHCYPSELLDSDPALSEMIRNHDVLMVEMGHTHYNEIANDGRVIYAATRSTGQIEEGPVGFSVSVLDHDVVSWKFKPLGEWPCVMITSPADERLITRPSHLNQVVRGKIEVHAMVFDEQPIVSVDCRIDDSGPFPMNRTEKAGGALWSEQWDACSVADGIHVMTITATNATGAVSNDTMGFCVSQPASYVPPARGAGDEVNAIGAYHEKGILGSQLGPNKNGRKW
jgi:3',5'-cyclic-AMP phosphodiesterase